MNRQLIVVGLVGCAGLLASAGTSVAHHAFVAEFDANKPIELRGVVTRADWINPHVWIYIDAKQPDGQVAKWEIELGTPNTLYRLGVTAAVVEIGSEIVVRGYQARGGQNRASGSRIMLTSGGKFIDLGGGPEKSGAPKE